jgi:hypothetical protein
VVLLAQQDTTKLNVFFTSPEDEPWAGIFDEFYLWSEPGLYLSAPPYVDPQLITTAASSWSPNKDLLYSRTVLW